MLEMMNNDWKILDKSRWTKNLKFIQNLIEEEQRHGDQRWRSPTNENSNDKITLLMANKAWWYNRV